MPIVTLTGTTMYARPWKDQIDREYEHETKGGCWSVGVKLDDASVKTFNALGSRAKLKDGVLKLRRYEYADYGKGPEELGTPVVTGVEQGTAIGNGSEVRVAVEVYPFEYKGKPGVGMRWESMDVTNLVPYVKAVGVVATEDAPLPF